MKTCYGRCNAEVIKNMKLRRSLNKTEINEEAQLLSNPYNRENKY